MIGLFVWSVYTHFPFSPSPFPSPALSLYVTISRLFLSLRLSSPWPPHSHLLCLFVCLCPFLHSPYLLPLPFSFIFLLTNTAFLSLHFLCNLLYFSFFFLTVLSLYLPLSIRFPHYSLPLTRTLHLSHSLSVCLLVCLWPFSFSSLSFPPLT
jgi:hypothetical protein